MAVKFHCEACGDHKPVLIGPIAHDELNAHAWGDIVCTECAFVIATISADVPGQYEFARVPSQATDDEFAAEYDSLDEAVAQYAR